MINWIKKMLGQSSVDLAALVNEGAKIIDVRSRSEFAAGHTKGAVNLPLEEIGSKSSSFHKDEVLLLCCRSGMRSGAATTKLKALGFTRVYNAGAWTNLNGLKK
jgi:phage shock protein E